MIRILSKGVTRAVRRAWPAFMSHSLLLIEDEKPVADLVIQEFQANQWSVRVATEGLEGLRLLRDECPDVVLLDVGLPDVNGFELCRRIRADPSIAHVPIVFLTAKNDEIDRVVGLEIGADDYLGKPFSVRELRARVHAVLRRSRGPQSETCGASLATDAASAAALFSGDLRLDRGRRTVTVQGREVSVRAREFDLLVELMRTPGQVHGRADLLKTIWRYERPSEVLTRTVDVHVRRLRQKLGTEGWRIQTVKRVGYRFSGQLSDEAS